MNIDLFMKFYEDLNKDKDPTKKVIKNRNKQITFIHTKYGKKAWIQQTFNTPKQKNNSRQR
jgi:hypothetical protein